MRSFSEGSHHRGRALEKETGRQRRQTAKGQGKAREGPPGSDAACYRASCPVAMSAEGKRANAGTGRDSDGAVGIASLRLDARPRLARPASQNQTAALKLHFRSDLFAVVSVLPDC